MLQYRAFAGQQVAHWARNFSAMPDAQQRLLPSFQRKLERAQGALDVNSQLLTKIVVSGEKSGMIGPALSAARYHSTMPNASVNALDASKVPASAFSHPKPEASEYYSFALSLCRARCSPRKARFVHEHSRCKLARRSACDSMWQEHHSQPLPFFASFSKLQRFFVGGVLAGMRASCDCAVSVGELQCALSHADVSPPPAPPPLPSVYSQYP